MSVIQRIVKPWLAFFILLIPVSALATTYTVTSNADTNTSGTLRFAINQLNASGTSGNSASNNTININSGLGTITLTANLPVIQNNGVTINGPSTGQTISGAATYGLFNTYNASLTMNNLILSQGLAQGGNGYSGGGGGLGAGGGIYIDYGQTLNISSLTIQNCLAQGGAGSNQSSGYGGGGGASWTINSSAGTSTTGGGDYGGSSGTGGGTAYTATLSGYGGGNGGGGSGTVGAGGAGGGSGGGSAASTYNGGAGGYCGGGGGASDTTNNSAGGGGGNGGGAGSSGTFVGGGGGGYGSGGAPVTGSGTIYGGGGGGGFGGGGGSGSLTSTSGSEGGGGGGWGGGGGTGAIAGNGGNWAGNAVANGYAGGGAGIGGAIFVGDSAILQIGNSVTSTTNSTLGGTGGTTVTGYANDIFLFQNASVQFIPSSDLSVAFAIQGDTLATSANYDAGVTINTTNNSTVTMTSTSNNYQGGTNIVAGILNIANGSMPAIGDVTIGSGATLTLMVASVATTGNFTNNGYLNVESTFTPSGYTSFTSPGNIYVVSSLGNLTGAVTATGTLSLGQDSFGNTNAASMTTANALNFSAINLYNTSSLATNGSGSGGSVTGNLYVLGTATFSDYSTTSFSGTMLTTGQDSFGNTDSSTAFSASQAITGYPQINVNAGTFTSNGKAISNVNTSFNVASGASATLNAALTGTGTTNISGTLTNATTNALALSGLITINGGGTLSVTENLTLANTINCAGNIAVSSSKDLTINAGLYTYNSASISGPITGGGSSSLIVGQDSLGNAYSSTNVTFNSHIISIPTINVRYGSLTSDGTVSGVDTALTVAAGASATFNGPTSGNATIDNQGTFNSSRAITFPAYTSTGSTGFVITDKNLFGRLIISGTAALGAGGISVSSNFTTAIAGNIYTWDLVTAASITPDPVTYSLPPQTVANSWSLTQTSSKITLQLVKGKLLPNVPVIGPVITQISEDPTNAGQFALVNSLGNSLTQDQLNTYVQELIPDLNSSEFNVMRQDAIFGQVGNRMAAVRKRLAYGEYTGFVAGDIDVTNSFWLGPFGSFAEQDAFDYNPGYRAYSGGFIVGLDSQYNPRNMLGIAGAISTTNVESKVNPLVSSRTNGYHVLFYGNHSIGNDYQNFIEWMLTGASNVNNGNREIYITGTDYSANHSYHSYQAGAEVNYGYSFNCAKNLDITPLVVAEYNIIYTPAYSEQGSSAAALFVENQKYKNILTLGIGGELDFKSTLSWLAGTPSLSGILAYDVLRTQDTVAANFLFGSSTFTYVNAPARLSLNLGANCTFNYNHNTQIEFLYELQLRQGYVNNAGTMKFKYIF
jgi:hypothetical protein